MSEEERLLVDPNTADTEALIQLPGVGEALAQRILDARPFVGVEDLLRVPGLGEGILGKISSHLVFQRPRELLNESGHPIEGESEEATGVVAASGEVSIMEAKEDAPIQEAVVPKSKPSRKVTASRSSKRGIVGRKDSFWFLVGAVVVSVALSILSLLAILGGINHTLDIGQHAAVRQLSNDLARIRTDLDGINSRMEAIGRRMEVIEGLSGRVKAVESEFSSLRGEVELLLREIEGSVNLIDGLATDVQALSEKISRFDEFLDGLRQLLGDPSMITDPEVVPQP